MLTLLVCSGPSDRAVEDTEPSLLAETDPDTEPETTEPEPETEQSSPDCPEGMAAVTHGDGRLAFCIDRYELAFEGDWGSHDQYGPDAEPPSGTLTSAAGQTPTAGLSWGQAAALCQAHGRTLATSGQWIDAADGVVGPGGPAYPYGDAFDESACACLSEDEQVLYPEPLPTGSLPSCVSAFGVFDQSGNLFEWTDPQRTFDVAGWFADRPDLARDEDRITATALSALKLDVSGIAPSSLSHVDGELRAWAGEGWSWEDQGDPKGVLVDEDSGSLLPVVVRPVDGIPGPARVLVLDRFDGQPITDKRGGSHYSGTQNGCRNDQGYVGHLHDFDGSIGFRCVWIP